MAFSRKFAPAKVSRYTVVASHRGSVGNNHMKDETTASTARGIYDNIILK